MVADVPVQPSGGGEPLAAPQAGVDTLGRIRRLVGEGLGDRLHRRLEADAGLVPAQEVVRAQRADERAVLDLGYLGREDDPGRGVLLLVPEDRLGSVGVDGVDSCTPGRAAPE
jgi:hypothetical protein